jgi:hypothetical protein
VGCVIGGGPFIWKKDTQHKRHHGPHLCDNRHSALPLPVTSDHGRQGRNEIRLERWRWRWLAACWVPMDVSAAIVVFGFFRTWRKRLSDLGATTHGRMPRRSLSYPERGAETITVK